MWWIYLVDVGGDKQCWKAQTPQEAMNLSLESYVQDAKDADAETPDDPSAEVWKRTFRSCERIGQLLNP